MKYLVFLSIAFLFSGCSSSVSQNPPTEPPMGFNEYWYAGEAEITSYELTQARYGETHTGKAVLVFVTEPFSRSKQVKLDNWRDQSADNVSVMKLNMTKKFLTGIYPYSMMMSVFTPVSSAQNPKTFKVTTSSQEWCGHTFMQLNLNDESYDLKGYSYFESEGDVDMNVGDVVLEDELLTRIRLNPATLPTGEVELLPSTFYLRLRHQEAQPMRAEAQLSSVNRSDFSATIHNRYSLSYSGRSLSIYFKSEFPYEILGWEENYLSGFGTTERLTTTAKRINTIKSAYWGKNRNSDRKIRQDLGLSME